ncbi:MAG: hypothetical protein J6W84_04365 [Bacteroidales bacterium]|nr:hypothetical protein [Bacteroidales bacterium]
MKKCCRDFVFAFCCVLAVAFGGCGGYKHATIPEVDVNFTIYPNDASYAALNHIGGYMYFTGGVAGIVIYRLDGGTFLAYDRACPYDWEDKEAWIKVESSGLTLIDEHCGSRFNILDGGVIEGPAQFPLKCYKTRFDGMVLRVYN